MAIDQVHKIQLQPLERAVDGLHQVFAVERVLLVDRVALARQAPEELGRDDVVQPVPAQRLEGLAHDHFALALGIDLGVVEEVHAGVKGRGQHLGGGVGVDLDPERVKESLEKN